MNVKLGIAPIGWTNDDMPDLGGGITFEQCVSEMALAGYQGCEIGNKFPSDTGALLDALALRGLRVANRWFSSFLLTQPFGEVERDFRESCAFLHAVGAERIGVSEQSHSIQGLADAPIFEKKYVMDSGEWRALADGLSRLGHIAREYGIVMTYHHHMGTVVQTADEIDMLMELTDAESVFLLYDTGHLAYCGEDHLRVLNRHVGRVRHVHLKDVRPEVIARVKVESFTFLQGVRLGTFTVPGDGAIDFAPVFSALENAGYEGWLLVEAEQDPAAANPLRYAKMAREYIRETAGI